MLAVSCGSVSEWNFLDLVSPWSVPSVRLMRAVEVPLGPLLRLQSLLRANSVIRRCLLGLAYDYRLFGPGRWLR